MAVNKINSAARPRGAGRPTGGGSTPPAARSRTAKSRVTTGPSAAGPGGAPRTGDDRHVFELAELPDLGEILPALCGRYREILDEQKRLESERKELSSQITPLLEAYDADSVVGDGWTASRVTGVRTMLMPELLLENGVAMDIIDKSTKRVEYSYLQVRAADPDRG